MAGLRELARDRRALLAGLLCLGIAVAFWSGSRYPDLGEKAQMGGSAILEDPLGFEALRAVDEADPFATRVLDTTINWIATNQRGMTFGLAFAAAFMTLLRRLGRRGFEGAFSNTLLGVVIGAPLGVCVNCAAPIARGLHAAGSRLETSLAAMISSPTLNFVVLTMLFSMLPLYMAAFKLVTGLVFVVVGIPLLARFAFRREVRAGIDSALEARGAGLAPPVDEALFERSEGFASAARWLLGEYASNLWFIVKYTVPLMLLAGLLGALAVTTLPWETLIAALPHDDSWNAVGWMAAIAVFGLLLPVPIAFDVVLATVLFAAGMPGHYVMVLLFSLGIFSVYSFLVVWEAVSLKVAGTLSLVLVLLSVGLGVAAQRYESWDGSRQRALFAALGEASLPPRELPPLPSHTPAEALLPELADRALAWQEVAVEAPPGISVSRRAFARSPEGGDGPLFARHYGDALGLERVDHVPLAYKFTSPFYRAWPIAAGDVHGDGWIDLVVGSDQGVLLYANRGGERFERQAIAQPTWPERGHVANLALVDLDGDGWLDVFVSSIARGNHVLYNREGAFPRDAVRALPELPATFASGVAFGDLDRDGRLDVALGNYTGGTWSVRPPERSRNFLLRSRGAQGWEVERLPGQPGQTLSTLISDLDQDGHPELLIGNDFETPDYFYQGEPGGGLRLLTRRDRIVQATTSNTMSIDSADIDNDGTLEVYVAQVARRTRGSAEELAVEVDEACREHSDPAWRHHCEERAGLHDVYRAARRRNGAVACLTISDALLRADCVAFSMLRFTLDDRDFTRCALLRARWQPLETLCRLAVEPEVGSSQDKKVGVRQLRNRNVLLVRSEEGRYEDRAKDLGVARGGWSWTSRFADLDNDGFQDLFIANGYYASKRRESNLFYRNRQGRGFEDATQAAGLVSFQPAGAYVYVDYDDDGDLDIVTSNFDGPLWVHRNSQRGGHAIVFELADARGNHFGIGSRVRVRDASGREQLRELKAGGGYVSFDAPRVHFGLGEEREVAEVRVDWPDGESSVLRGPFAAGHRYRIGRGDLTGISARASARTPASPARPGT